MVIIDTSIWVQALRAKDSHEKAEVDELIERREAAVVGVIYVEVLRGARSQVDLDELSDQLLGPAFIESSRESWLLAGQLLLDLKLKGLTIPFQDAAIAAQALNGEHAVYTHDEHFRRVPGLRLYAA